MRTRFKRKRHTYEKILVSALTLGEKDPEWYKGEKYELQKTYKQEERQQNIQKHGNDNKKDQHQTFDQSWRHTALMMARRIK